MNTITDLKPITQAEYLEAELEYLLRRLAEGDRKSAATSIATLQRELWKLNPDDATCGRITTENGQYYRWPFLDV